MARNRSELLGVRLEEWTHEELVIAVKDLRGRLGDLRTGHDAAAKAIKKRCVDLREAKRLANKRADAAERTLREFYKSIRPIIHAAEQIETGEQG